MLDDATMERMLDEKDFFLIIKKEEAKDIKLSSKIVIANNYLFEDIYTINNYKSIVNIPKHIIEGAIFKDDPAYKIFELCEPFTKLTLEN